MSEKKKDSEKKDLLEERVFNIPLSSAWRMPIKKRTPRAIRDLRAYISKSMKTNEISISSEVNETFWKHGTEGSPRHLRVRAEKTKDNRVTVYLVNEE